MILDPKSLEAVLLKALILEKLRDLDLARSLLEVHVGNQDFVRTEWEVRRTGTEPCDEEQCITAEMTPTMPEPSSMGLRLVYRPDGQLVQLAQGNFEAGSR